MSWFGGQQVSEIDIKIEEATSEAIPNGELDIAVGLEITDLIRSKKVPPKQAMRSLKKRLTKVYSNPNLLSSTLKLVDLCVKNGGSHFIAELNTKEFVDYLVDYIFKVHYDTKDAKVYSSEAKYGTSVLLLKFIKEWSLYLKGRFDPNHLDRHYKLLVKQDYEFPEIDTSAVDVGSNFIDSNAPPDWLDGKDCMICYAPFSVMNRKHHCRACGGVFCQTHSSKNIPLVSLGILQPVRVCDDCHEIHKSKNSKEVERGVEAAGNTPDEDDELRKAIELSLQDSLVSKPYVPQSYQPPAGAPNTFDEPEEMDADLKAAIEASLRELNPHTYQLSSQGQRPELQSNTGSYALLSQNQDQNQDQDQNRNRNRNQNQNQEQLLEPELDFYQNIMPFDSGSHNMGLSDSQLLAPISREQSTSYLSATQPPKASNEDLTPEEEDAINLFVQLLNGIKTDRAKQANIIHDKDLQELNAKVVQLKPKLNRSLRVAIEKYDLFLQMSNKISTITRLYDLFLEAKLNMAYANHRVSSPTSQYGTASQKNTLRDQYSYGVVNLYGKSDRHASGQIAGYAQQPTRVAQQSTGVAQQPTGYEQQPTGYAQQPTGYAQQHTGYAQQPTRPPVNQAHRQMDPSFSHSGFPVAASKQNTGLSIPHPSAQLSRTQDDFSMQSESPAYPSSTPTDTRTRPRLNLQSTPYPVEEGGHYNPAHESTGPAYPSNTYDVALNNMPEANADAIKLQGGESSQAASQLHHQPFMYPSEPAYLSDEEASDAESVASRYPPLEGFSDEDRKPQSDDHTQHASTRYPDIEVEGGAEPTHSNLTIISKTPSLDSRKFKAEPEPLIEL